MVQSAKVTLYDVFCYLLPGLLFLGAVGILFWAFHYPDAPLNPDLRGAEAWIVVLVIAYLAGHMAQAFSNWLLFVLACPLKWLQKRERLKSWKWLQSKQWCFSNESICLSEGSAEQLPADVLLAAQQKVTTFTGIVPETLKTDLLFRFCDEAVVQRGTTGDREIFVYREGFYRGTWAALVAVCIALLFRLNAGTANLLAPDGPKPIGRDAILFLFWTCVVFSYFSFRRFRRFGRYRISQAILAFLTMPEEKKKEKKEND
jgi:hypothetical protein